jgi:hypothetical protein
MAFVTAAVGCVRLWVGKIYMTIKTETAQKHTRIEQYELKLKAKRVLFGFSFAND